VGELAGGFHPAENVKVEVVAAGAAFDEKREDGKERGYWDDKIREPGSVHGESIAE
jgi:hypothetical protein